MSSEYEGARDVKGTRGKVVGDVVGKGAKAQWNRKVDADGGEGLVAAFAKAVVFRAASENVGSGFGHAAAGAVWRGDD